ncbi:MAG: uncharacterized protein K0S40_3194 [Actinomycetospora sp.]|jgi:hypothetical protein|nr:uncharacterized protein [Actinomycetospora sp.]
MTDRRRYEFRVEPAVPAASRDAFCDMEREDTTTGTVLRGDIVDDSHLHGVLAQLRALGLTVVSAQPLDRPLRP